MTDEQQRAQGSARAESRIGLRRLTRLSAVGALALTALLVPTAAAVAAPEQDPPAQTEASAAAATHTVSFDTGDGQEIAPVEVEHGAPLPLPAGPMRDGYRFAGWFLDSAHETAFDPSIPVESNTTLFAAWDETGVVVDGIEFSIDPDSPERGATAWQYTGPQGIALEIPRSVTIGGVEYPVTVIDELVFDSAGLTAITFPDTLVEILDFAFWTNDLREVVIPDSVRHIGLAAFAENPIERLELGAQVETIGDAAFIGNQLREVRIPASVTEISGDAFGWNPDLVSVYFDGPAPGIEPAEYSGSFGDAEGKTLYVRSQHVAAAPEDGFTLPTWMGYSVALMTHTVSFETGDGSAVEQALVQDGDTVRLPEEPTLAKHTFAGWFLDAAGTQAFDPATPVLADLTLYASWKPVTVQVDPTDPDPANPKPTPRPAEDTLPATGADLTPVLTAAGLALTLVGAGLLAARRRRA